MVIDEIVAALDGPTVARVVGRPFDEARIAYQQGNNVAASFAEYRQRLGDFYNHEHTRCISQGGALDDHRAISRAEEIIEREYRRRGGDIVTAFNDAHDGTQGGLRSQYDIIVEAMKHEAIEDYVRSVFENRVARNSFDEKVELMRQLIERAGPHLSNSIARDQPERYAEDYQALVREYVESIRRTASALRRH